MKAERGGVDAKRGRSNGPVAVFVLSDGIKGHENQSLGVASRLEDFGAAVDTFRIPRLFGYRRFKSLKVTSRRLVHKKAVQCMKWLESSGGEDLLEKIKGRLQRAGIDGKDVLFLSAGSSAAPYCLALACVTGAKSCTVMTPSVLGTKPFDFAVVPEHDQPGASENVLVTLGAPNRIRPELLEREKAILERRFPPRRPKRWGVLLGGDDKNYHVSPEWAESLMKILLEEARIVDADIYVTTSRRTSPETEHALKQTAGGDPNVPMLLLASEDDWNPVPGMLGLCEQVLCTEDSVSMISEAATAGRRPIVLGVPRKNNVAAHVAKIVALFAEKEFCSKGHVFGVPRFERMIEIFEKRGLCRYLEDKNGLAEILEKSESTPTAGFDEARRAAEWIAKRWSR
jgi:hypothetical protein